MVSKYDSKFECFLISQTECQLCGIAMSSKCVTTTNISGTASDTKKVLKFHSFI